MIFEFDEAVVDFVLIVDMGEKQVDEFIVFGVAVGVLVALLFGDVFA